MSSHVEAYEKADKAAITAATAPSSVVGEQQRRHARKAREAAASRLHASAKEIGRHGGEFLTRRKDEAPRSHAHRLATLHGSSDYDAGVYTDGSHRFNFRGGKNATKHAEQFHKSLQHHYPGWKSETRDWVHDEQTPGARGPRFRYTRFREGAVHFHPDHNWAQPAERK
jgi:hypothetical protein